MRARSLSLAALIKGVVVGLTFFCVDVWLKSRLCTVMGCETLKKKMHNLEGELKEEIEKNAKTRHRLMEQKQMI